MEKLIHPISSKYAQKIELTVATQTVILGVREARDPNAELSPLCHSLRWFYLAADLENNLPR